MAIQTTTRSVDAVSTGAETEYPFPFACIDEDFLVVKTIDEADVETTLVLGQDYTVDGEGDATGTVTLTNPATSGHTVRIARVVPLLQPTELRTQGPLAPGVLETMADRLTAIVQQLNDGAIQADEVLAGEVNVGANIGSGVGVYDGKSGETLQFRSIIGSDRVTVTHNDPANQIEIDVPDLPYRANYHYDSGSAAWEGSGSNMGVLPEVGSELGEGICVLEFTTAFADTGYIAVAQGLSDGGEEISCTLTKEADLLRVSVSKRGDSDFWRGDFSIVVWPT